MSPYKKKKKKGSVFQENLEAVVIAVALALIIRYFILESFVIPTGSMAPTLKGRHIDITCPNCGYRFDASSPKDESASIECPMCGHFMEDVGKKNTKTGNRIIVNKFIYKISKPKRWHLVVFRPPKEKEKNFIKRLIGLPGERLMISNGDIYINGKIQRKPLDVQSAIWMPVYNSNFQAKVPPWDVTQGDRSIWKFEKRYILASAFEKEGYIEYKKEIKDCYAYNATRGFGASNSVGDLKFSFKFKIEKGDGGISVILQEFEDLDIKEFEVFLGKNASFIKFENKKIPIDLRVIPQREYTVEFANVDNSVILKVDGRNIYQANYESNFIMSKGACRIGAKDSEAGFYDICIERDIYYIKEGDYGSGEVVIPEGCYFVMGDNSPSSNDSRKWGFVPESRLLGKAFLVIWPALPWDWQARFIK